MFQKVDPLYRAGDTQVIPSNAPYVFLNALAVRHGCMAHERAAVASGVPRSHPSILFWPNFLFLITIIMVFGIITAIAACPAIVGTNEAVMQGQKQNAREKHRGLKSNLVANCDVTSRYASVVNGAAVVLQYDKVSTIKVIDSPKPNSSS
jgi:hypothetical protein